jgi:hypothetical protein
MGPVKCLGKLAIFHWLRHLFPFRLFPTALGLVLPLGPIPPLCPPSLERLFECVQADRSDQFLEVRFDKNDFCTGGQVAEVLASFPQFVIDGGRVKARRSKRDGRRKERVGLKVSQEDPDIEWVEKDVGAKR